jgi:hypothetical protein
MTIKKDEKSASQEAKRQEESHSNNPCGRAGKDESKKSPENPLGCNIKTEEDKHQTKSKGGNADEE